MEPQLFSCGLHKHSCSSGSSGWPSMEPQLFSCGLMTDWLKSVTVNSPSMEPQLFSCGLKENFHNDKNNNNPPSMEPQLFSCGLRQSRFYELCWFYAFNGAATFQLRIVLPTITWRQYQKTFNGAATFQLRIECGTYQLSRHFIKPSMEPQLFSCGLLFYEAFAGQPLNIPSMEPQLFSCGLWQCPFYRCDRCSPSMEPQLFSCGLEPQNRCLRWCEHPLQWSRNFSVADCWMIMWITVYCHSPFNGAATFQLRIVLLF